MGDRGNIAMVFDKERTQQVWIYSHWGGSDLSELLRAGLAAGKSRWGDDSYLARIILCNVIPANLLAETTGFGISCTMQDNEHPILVVDMPTKTVFKMPELSLDKQKWNVPEDYKPGESWTFEEYIALVPA